MPSANRTGERTVVLAFDLPHPDEHWNNLVPWMQDRGHEWVDADAVPPYSIIEFTCSDHVTASSLGAALINAFPQCGWFEVTIYLDATEIDEFDWCRDGGTELPPQQPANSENFTAQECAKYTRIWQGWRKPRRWPRRSMRRRRMGRRPGTDRT